MPLASEAAVFLNLEVRMELPGGDQWLHAANSPLWAWPVWPSDFPWDLCRRHTVSLPADPPARSPGSEASRPRLHLRQIGTIRPGWLTAWALNPASLPLETSPGAECLRPGSALQAASPAAPSGLLPCRTGCHLPWVPAVEHLFVVCSFNFFNFHK